MYRAIVLFLPCFLLSAFTTTAQGIYRFDTKIALPGDGGCSYVTIDHLKNNLYVTHGTNLHIINLKGQKLVRTIDGLKDIRGVAIVNSANKFFVSDAKANTVIVYSLVNFEKIATIAVSGKKPDAIIFDPFSQKVFAFNNDSHNVSVIDVNLLKELTVIDLPGEPEYAVADGKGFIYNNIEDKNSIAKIDTKQLKLVNTFSISPCGAPTALAMDTSNKRLFSACRENKGMSVINAENNQVITTLPIGAGVNAICYDETNKIIVVANADATATIIHQNSANDYSVIQTLATTAKARTFAMDSQTKNIYFGAPVYDGKAIQPNSLAIYVYQIIK